MKQLIAAALLALPGLAAADKLRVDVLLFYNTPAADERSSAPRRPYNDSAIAIDDARALADAGIAMLPERGTTLAVEWATLSRRGYQPARRLSWVQEPPRTEGGPALRVYLPGSDGISGIFGWLSLHRDKRLQLSADLEAIQAAGGQAPTAYRLQERRTLELGVLNYLDSPRIGVLARVTPMQ